MMPGPGVSGLTAGTLNAPVVDSDTSPPACTASPSTFSDDAASATSLPSMYHAHVPAVVLPIDDGANSSTSCALALTPGTETEPLVEISWENQRSVKLRLRNTANIDGWAAAALVKDSSLFPCVHGLGSPPGRPPLGPGRVTVGRSVARV